MINQTVIDVMTIRTNTLSIKMSSFGTKKIWGYKTGGLLKGSITIQFSMIGQEQCDLSIQVTA